MADEAMLEDYDWESDEAEDFESDEAVVETDESDEHIGERARRRRRRGRRRFRPARGVRGVTVRDADGRTRNVPFPAKLATTEETNRGLANQEAGRRALEERLDKLEARARQQQKNDSSASGLVSLVTVSGLAGYGVYEAGKKASGVSLKNWAAEGSTKVATFASFTQIATSAAKLAINGRYHRSGVGIAADIVSAAQLVTFAWARLSPAPARKPKFWGVVANPAARNALLARADLEEGDEFKQGNFLYEIRRDALTNNMTALQLRQA